MLPPRPDPGTNPAPGSKIAWTVTSTSVASGAPPSSELKVVMGIPGTTINASPRSSDMPRASTRLSAARSTRSSAPPQRSLGRGVLDVCADHRPLRSDGCVRRMVQAHIDGLKQGIGVRRIGVARQSNRGPARHVSPRGIGHGEAGRNRSHRRRAWRTIERDRVCFQSGCIPHHPQAGAISAQVGLVRSDHQPFDDTALRDRVQETYGAEYAAIQ